MEQITALPADTEAVAAVLRTLGPVAVVRMIPVAVVTAAGTRRRTDVQLWAEPGRLLPATRDAAGDARIARDAVQSAFPGRTWANGAFDYHAFSGRLVPVVDLRVAPGVPVLPLADSLAADADDDPATLDLGTLVADAQDGGAR